MIEIYAFLTMFALQILALSVMFPARFIRYARAKAAEYPAEALALLYPRADPAVETEKLLNRFRTAHWVIAAAGFALLAWMAWMAANAPPLPGVKMMIFPVFFLLLQMLPMLIIAVTGLRQIAMLRAESVERKRKALLQPRGLSDLVSPQRVAVEITIYLAFVGFVLYLMHVASSPIPASLGYPLIAAITAGLALQAAYLYWRLRGRKIPLESPAERMRTTSDQAKHSVYGTMSTVVFLALVILLPRMGLENWLPFALSTFLVFVALQFCVSVSMPRSRNSH